MLSGQSFESQQIQGAYDHVAWADVLVKKVDVLAHAKVACVKNPRELSDSV